MKARIFKIVLLSLNCVVQLIDFQLFVRKFDALVDNILMTQPYTVKPVLSGHSKIDKAKTLMTNGRLMKSESVAECCPWSILQYF